jgi:hypothetical protein
MSHEDRVLALTDGGMDHSAATRAAGKDWERLSHSEQGAFSASLTAIAERNKPGVSRASGRSKMNKAFTKIESPEELLPSEVREAVEMTRKLIESFGIMEAAKRAAGKMGKSKNMPTQLITKLEVYLGKVMKESLAEDDAPAAAAPGAPSPVAGAAVAAVGAVTKKKDDDDDDDEEKKEDGTEKQTLLGKSPIADNGIVLNPDSAPVIEPHAEPHDEPEKKDDDEDDAPKKDEPEAKKGDDDEGKKDEDDDEKKDKEEPEAEKKDKDDAKDECGEEEPVVAEPKDDDETKKDAEDESNATSMQELLRLALGATRMQKGSQMAETRRAPKAILIGEATSGTGGAPAVGVLDVFSYGSYLEKTLPYLVAATTSRMSEEDKVKFVNVFRKFVETNDLVQLTSLAGKLADSVEYCDATQEGAELTKTFRFLGDFLNMMRASVDYTKKALSQ